MADLIDLCVRVASALSITLGPDPPTLTTDPQLVTEVRDKILARGWFSLASVSGPKTPEIKAVHHWRLTKDSVSSFATVGETPGEALVRAVDIALDIDDGPP